MSWFLISATIAALILAGEGVWTWHTHRREVLIEYDHMAPRRTRSTSALPVQDDTVTFPALWPDPCGWSAQVGRTAWDLLAEARRRVANEAWVELMLSGLDDAPICAELVARQSVLAIEPAPKRELIGAQL